MTLESIIKGAAILAIFVLIFIAKIALDKAKAAEGREAEARRALASCEQIADTLQAARQADQITTAAMEKKQHDTAEKMADIRRDSCHVDDDSRLDERLRELAREAYRVALCSGTDDPSVQTADRPGKP